MVVHQTVGVAYPIIAYIDVLKGVQKVHAVLVVFENILFFITAGGNVIDSASVFYAKGGGSYSDVSIERGESENKRPDPMEFLSSQNSVCAPGC